MSGALFHRVAHTPLRDILRLRLTGRLDRVTPLNESALAPELKQLITKVTRRTRLWRLEKADVTRELVAHFSDAADAGASVDDAVARFGDLKQAARLIRRAKMRQRSIVWWTWRRGWQTTLATVLLVSAVYAVLAARFFIGSPTVNRNYLAEINAPALAAPESERGWPMYREAKLLLARPTDAMYDAGFHSPEALADPDVEAMTRTYLAENERALELIREGAAAPIMGAVLSNEVDRDLLSEHDGYPSENTVPLLQDAVIGVNLPQMWIMRRFATVLTADAFIAAKDGDAARAEADLLAIASIGSHCRELPFLIADLVSFAILHLHVQTVGDLLHDHPGLFSEQALVRIGHATAAACSNEATQIDWRTERMMFDDLVQRVYTDDGTGDGRIVFSGLKNIFIVQSLGDRHVELDAGSVIAGPVSSAVGAGRRELMRAADQIYAHAARICDAPLWTWDADLMTPPVDFNGVNRVRLMPLFVMIPEYERTAFIRERFLLVRESALTAVAIELYHRRHGAYPDSLDELSPDLLPSTPVDRFTGQPIRYALRDGAPLLYSLGPDGRDDGGEPTESDIWFEAMTAFLMLDDEPEATGRFRGDMILWPRPRNSN